MKVRPPRIRDSYIIIWASITAVLVIACAALGIGLATARHQSTIDSRARKTADCINDALRTRSSLTELDHLNEAKKIADQTVAVKDQAAGIHLILTGDNPVQGRRGALLYQRGVSEFVQSLARWQARDAQINAERAKTPLGRC